MNTKYLSYRIRNADFKDITYSHRMSEESFITTIMNEISKYFYFDRNDTEKYGPEIREKLAKIYKDGTGTFTRKARYYHDMYEGIFIVDVNNLQTLV